MSHKIYKSESTEGNITKTTTTEFYDDGSRKITYTECESGNNVSKIEKTTCINKYSAITSMILKEYDVEIERKTIEYDDNGDETISSSYNSNTKITTRKTINYHENGRKKQEILSSYNSDTNITTKQTMNYHENGKIESGIVLKTKDDVEIERDTTEYDKDGNLKSQLYVLKTKDDVEIERKTTEYDKDGNLKSQLYQKNNDPDNEYYRKGVVKNGKLIVTDYKGNIMKYNENPHFNISFASIDRNGATDITNIKTKLLCKAINKIYNKKIADIHYDTIYTNTIDAVINDKLKDNQVLSLGFTEHQVCVAKIGGELFSIGMFYDNYRPEQKVKDISLTQSSREGPCVNLADIMVLFASKWINERKGANPDTAANDFEKAITDFANEYQNKKLYDWYAKESLAVRAWIPLPDFVTKNMQSLEEYNKLSPEDKKEIKKTPVSLKNHQILSNDGSKPNHHGFLGNVAVTQKNGKTQNSTDYADRSSGQKIQVNKEKGWRNFLSKNKIGVIKEM